MNQIKLKRLESLSQRELSLWFINKSKDDNLKQISVTSIKITNDLSFMTIYYTCYEQDKKEYYKEVLEGYKSQIRAYLASKIEARKMPELIFKYDESLDYGNHIEDLLKQIKE